MAGRIQHLMRYQFMMTSKVGNLLQTSSAVRQLCTNLSGRRFTSLALNMRQNNKCYPLACESSNVVPCRLSSTVSGWMTSALKGINFKFRMKYSKFVLRRSSLRLYLCCVELIDHDMFLREFELPDTFNSWFRVTELHVWLCMVRLVREGKEGKFVRNNMIQFMWEDVEKKSKKLGRQGVSTTARIDGIQVLSQQFMAILYAYDEGMMGDDKVLAGALWRNFFEKDCEDITNLERMVEYVRKQLCMIDQIESDVLLTSGLMPFTPMNETPEVLERNRLVVEEIKKRL